MEADNNYKEPISLKKLGQGYASWSTQKMVLGWNLNTVSQFLRLPPKQQSKVHVVLEATPQSTV